MNEEQLLKLRYPIGKFNADEAEVKLKENIKHIAQLPELLTAKLAGLSAEQLQLPYRPDGWNIKQVVHHLSDSHINSFIRHKLTLTEDEPIVKSYNEKEWAKLLDGQSDDVEDSLQILKSVHGKWVNIMESMDHRQFVRNYIHPAKGRKVSLITNTALYAWHGLHHLAHIDQALEHEGSF